MTVLLDERATLSTAALNNLPDSAFAYIQPGGSKDSEGKTVPRSLRHFAIHDAAHVRNALARIGQGAEYGKEAMPKVMRAAKRFGIQISDNTNSRPDLGLCVRAFDFEFESRGGDGRTLEGYAAVFNTPTTIRDVSGDFEETILPGAFKRSLSERMPILQWDHGKDPRVGTVPIGAIEDLAEDSRGLHVRARLFHNDVVEPVRQAIEAQAVRGMSFRFGVPKGGDKWPTRDQRHIRDADVHELGPVAFPAYDTTSVSVRSMLAQLDPDEHRALAREFATYFQVPILRAATDTDEDPDTLAQAVDVAIDEALAALPDDVPRAIALLTAADATMDDLLDAMGVEDLPDPPARSRPTDLTGRPAQGAGGGEPGTEPGGDGPQIQLRQRIADNDALRLKGILK